MLFTSLRMILVGALLACLLPAEACVAGGISSYFAHEHHAHRAHEPRHKWHQPAPRAAVIESAAIRRVARPTEEDAQRPESGEQDLESRVSQLEQNYTRLNQEVGRLADLLQRQIDILDKTR
jgi:hypothetical protein